MKENELWGRCQPPLEFVLKDYVQIIDKTGDPNHTGFFPYSSRVYEEGWSRYLTIGIVVHAILISLAHDQNVVQPILRQDINVRPDEMPPMLFDHFIWMLIDAGFIEIVQETELSVISLHTPPVNPSFRVESFHLEVIRGMSSYEDEEDDESSTKRSEKDLDSTRNCSEEIFFPLSGKEKIFREAQEHGGRIWRSWGPYREIIAEFSGEAWD